MNRTHKIGERDADVAACLLSDPRPVSAADNRFDEAAALLINGGGDSDAFDVRFRGRTTEPDQDELDAAELSFAGGWSSLEFVDEAVAEYRSGEHGQ